MGNQHHKNSYECNIEPIKAPESFLNQGLSHDENFVQQIQEKNEKNVNQRKSIGNPVQLRSKVQPQLTVNAKMSRKQSQKKQLPPLKLKNMKATPLADCQNYDNLAANIAEDFEEMRCQKGDRSVSMLPQQQSISTYEDREQQDQKQNNEATSKARPKKFRPSQNLAKRSPLTFNTPINQYLNQMPDVEWMPESQAFY